MIGYLRGEVLLTKTDSLIINVGGVGYNVFCPASFLARASGTVEVFVTTVVREDAIALYGFETAEEQTVFEKLMSVSGVGAKSAVAALSVMTAGEIVNAILTEDVSALSQIPKVGKKTANQIILDLRDKLADVPVTASDDSINAKQIAEAVDALTGLGYSSTDAKKAVKDAVSGMKSFDTAEIIRLALKQITGGRF